jgi:uncharacterized protein with HEPN domain
MTDDRLYFIHIRDTIARIKKFTKGGKDAFLRSDLVQDATIRNLQILTESTQRLSDGFKRRHPDIDWHGIAGFRNVLVHGYLSLDLNRVWDVVERHASDLKRKLQDELRSLPSPPKQRRKRLTKKPTRRSKKRKS